MNARRVITSGAAVTAIGVLALAPPALAVCDSYSATCPTPPPSSNPPEPPELERTGSEVGTMSAIGLGALVGGTALVVVGRRRRSAPSA